MDDIKYVIREAANPIFCRWWLRVREVESIIYGDGSSGACHEFYVPFWAWPLEGLHRFVWFLKGNEQ